VQLKSLRPPPPLSLPANWRDLYVAGSFAQRELVDEGRLRSLAKERSFSLGIGHSTLEGFDAAGALRPIAFALRGYWTGLSVPAEDPENIAFREERDTVPWETYAWAYQHEPDYTTVSPLFSPWQLLYVDDVLEGTEASLNLETLLLPEEKRDAALTQLRHFLEGQDNAWKALDDGWSPLVKLLVALQNRYWPEVSNRTVVVSAREDEPLVPAGPDQSDFDAGATLEALGATEEEVLDAYYFLVERGLDRDPQDGLTMLRRARPRAFHVRWRGLARRAQDHFDAAEVLRLFLAELLGEPPPRPETWPLDGRQPERFALWDHGPAADWSPQEVKDELLSAELYPHGVHVLGEGASEGVMVERLVAAALGRRGLAEISFYDLRGSGSAPHVAPLAKTLGDYAVRALVIVDREGQMAEYVNAAIGEGTLPRDNVLLFDDSLEASNASTQELIDLAREIGLRPEAEEERVHLQLEPEELERYHTDRRERSSKNDKPGLADSLIRLARRKTDGRLDIDKLVLVHSLADQLVAELVEAGGPVSEGLAARRPIVAFVFDRLLPAINRPRPVG